VFGGATLGPWSWWKIDDKEKAHMQSSAACFVVATHCEYVSLLSNWAPCTWDFFFAVNSKALCYIFKIENLGIEDR
jgi:hypothetical protein